jgi:GAF domain-containing protein
VQDAFAYYHVHIYLIEEVTQDLVMVGGTGAAGRAMLADGHRIPQGRGLVGRAATTNTTVLVPDVRQDESWLPNSLLPDTCAEVAIPISIGERVLGVLDVQHNVTNGLSDNDADLHPSIANPVAIALQNTRLFAEAQKRARYEERVNLITQRIQNTTTVEEALQISIRELGRMLNTETLVRLRAGSEPDDDSAKLAFVSTDAGV